MGEGHVLGLPGPHLVEVQLSDTQQHMGGLTVDHVAAVVQHIIEAVELPLALEAVEGGLHDQRIEHPDIAHRGGVGPQVLGCDGRVEVVNHHLGDPVQPIGLPGRQDVALDVGGLHLGLGRLDPQALDHRRIDATHHKGHEQPQTDGEGG